MTSIRDYFLKLHFDLYEHRRLLLAVYIIDITVGFVLGYWLGSR